MDSGGAMYTLNGTEVHAVCYGVDLYNQCLTGGVSKTLNNRGTDADHVPCVLVYESHGQDCRYTPLGDTCSTISQKYGTGGQRADSGEV